ncbi:MAG: hypothetical protein AAGE98_03455 [Actinomycetota bacterium]
MNGDEIVDGRAYRCVHGHFRPRQFWSAGRNAKLVMWMRDPVDRIRSWYDFWDAIEPSGEPHHMEFKASGMSLAEFAGWHIVTGGFADIFLDGTDGLDSFEFIGLTERFDDDLAKLARRLGWVTTPEPGVRANTTPKTPTVIDAATRAAIERHHEVEIDFYRRAAERFA